jgi:hypothetical protein
MILCSAPMPLPPLPLPCGEYAEMAMELASPRYNEQQVAVGAQGGRAQIELWVAPDGTSWTILQHFADGRACIVAVGREWMERPAPGL